MKLYKKITRVGKTVLAEICYTTKKDKYEIQVDSKEFNWCLGGLFSIDPTDQDYNNAHKWADSQIDQYNRKGLNLKLPDDVEIPFGYTYFDTGFNPSEEFKQPSVYTEHQSKADNKT